MAEKDSDGCPSSLHRAPTKKTPMGQRTRTGCPRRETNRPMRSMVDTHCSAYCLCSAVLQFSYHSLLDDMHIYFSPYLLFPHCPVNFPRTHSQLSLPPLARTRAPTPPAYKLLSSFSSEQGALVEHPDWRSEISALEAEHRSKHHLKT